MFVAEVMELVELTPLRDAIVGLPRVTGLSTELRKRLSIAVELVANPSIIFMDEPTSRLDAHATAIVMRTVRNTVNTGPVGRHSHKLIEYFEVVPGVPKIIEGYNPAIWALEVSSGKTWWRFCTDFAEIYRKLTLYEWNQDPINELRTLAPGSQDLNFPTQYAQPFHI